MNRPTSQPRIRPIDPHFIDRLVDGELTGTERRALLAQLDAEPTPDGWKRCALAFLEAQAWREAFGPLATDEPAERPTKPARRPRLRVVGAKLALAAGFVLAAFAAGWVTGEARSNLGQGGAIQVADQPPAPAVNSKVEDQPEATLLSDPTDNWPEVRMVGFMQLPDQSDDRQPPLHVPILAGPGLDESWLRLQPSVVPDALRARWEDQGYRVEQRRRLVSMELDDGQYLALPVDEVDLHYTEPRMF